MTAHFKAIDRTSVIGDEGRRGHLEAQQNAMDRGNPEVGQIGQDPLQPGHRVQDDDRHALRGHAKGPPETRWRDEGRLGGGRLPAPRLIEPFGQ